RVMEVPGARGRPSSRPSFYRDLTRPRKARPIQPSSERIEASLRLDGEQRIPDRAGSRLHGVGAGLMERLDVGRGRRPADADQAQTQAVPLDDGGSGPHIGERKVANAPADHAGAAPV